MITIDDNMTKVLVFYVASCYVLYKIKPDIMFTKDGQFKPFGVGKEKTIAPYWLVSLLMGLAAYLFLKVKSDAFIDNQ